MDFVLLVSTALFHTQYLLVITILNVFCYVVVERDLGMSVATHSVGFHNKNR